MSKDVVGCLFPGPVGLKCWFCSYYELIYCQGCDSEYRTCNVCQPHRICYTCWKPLCTTCQKRHLKRNCKQG